MRTMNISPRRRSLRAFLLLVHALLDPMQVEKAFCCMLIGIVTMEDLRKFEDRVDSKLSENKARLDSTEEKLNSFTETYTKDRETDMMVRPAQEIPFIIQSI